MKDSKLAQELKSSMANWLCANPDTLQSFSDYLNAANSLVHPGSYDRFCKEFLKDACSLLDNKPVPNVIFGVLTNGEIFVEVNGEQHTPADEFYKMATIQSTMLAHKVRDLEEVIKTIYKDRETDAIFINKVSMLVHDHE